MIFFLSFIIKKNITTNYSFSGVFSLCGSIVTFIFIKARDVANFTILFEQAVQLLKQQTLHTLLQLSPVSL